MRNSRAAQTLLARNVSTSRSRSRSRSRKPWSLFIHDLTVTRETLTAAPLDLMDGGFAARAGGR